MMEITLNRVYTPPKINQNGIFPQTTILIEEEMDFYQKTTNLTKLLDDLILYLVSILPF